MTPAITASMAWLRGSWSGAVRIGLAARADLEDVARPDRAETERDVGGRAVARALAGRDAAWSRDPVPSVC
jgi:hypothetical protein